MAEAQVGFVPVDGDPTVKPARGQTDARGRYSLNTYLQPGQDVKGAMEGRYKVTVMKGIAQKRVIQSEELRNQQELLPSIYADARTTPLESQVTDGGSNEFNFALKDAD